MTTEASSNSTPSSIAICGDPEVTPHDTTADDSGSNQIDMRAVMMVIGTVGLLGNGFVIYVIFSFKGLRKKTDNLFIINQSALDLMVAVLLIGDATTRFVEGYNSGLKGLAGEVYCRLWLSGVLQWSMLVSSTYNLIMITIERYLMVVHPFHHKVAFTRKKAIIIMVAVWMIGIGYEFLSGIPTTVVVDGVCIPFSNFPSPDWQKAYGFITITVAFFVPTIVHPVLYGHMVVVMRKRASNLGNQSSTDGQRLSRTQRNLLKTSAIITICFFLCWSWNQMAFFFFNLGVNYDMTSSFHLFTIIAVNFNCCINPFVYVVKYEEFKRAARKLVMKRCLVDPGEQSGASSSTHPVSTRVQGTST